MKQALFKHNIPKNAFLHEFKGALGNVFFSVLISDTKQKPIYGKRAGTYHNKQNQ